MRPTFDERVLQPGASRVAIEEQLGKPQSIAALPDGDTEIMYRTSRMSHAAKQSLIAGHVESDAFTLGLAEIFMPAIIAENEGTVFAVDYDPAGKVTRIRSRCENARTAEYFNNLWMACQHAAAPL